jgi:hypothetical protein
VSGGRLSGYVPEIKQRIIVQSIFLRITMLLVGSVEKNLLFIFFNVSINEIEKLQNCKNLIKIKSLQYKIFIKTFSC